MVLRIGLDPDSASFRLRFFHHKSSIIAQAIMELLKVFSGIGLVLNCHAA
jgi:hypothetical protein